MSILVSGMEMPTSCHDCEIGGAKQLDKAGNCPFYRLEWWEQEEYRDRRVDGCPLVPVPQPHGRLGDLEQAVIILERLRDHCGNGDMAYALNWAAKTIRDLPTIIPADPPPSTHVVTNYDRLIRKTPEEMAKFLLDRDMKIVQSLSKVVEFTCRLDKEKCLKNIVDWLKEPSDTGS